jgi:photosystem II stability/assembly factor-like uncharacterized protein
MTFRRFIPVGLVLALLVTPAAAQRWAPLEPDYTGALHWRNVGPLRGGRALAVTGVPGHPERFYFGAVGGGVWRTDNAGRTWTPIFDSQPVSSIGAIAVAPSDPNIIYVGSGEADMRSDIIQGNGMYKSVDAGATWTRIGLTHSQAIGRIAIDPKDPDVVYVAALGHPYGPNAERGLFKTTDGGKTWTKSLFIDNDTGASDVVLDPNDAHVLYVSMWQTRRPPWSIYPPSNGPHSGLYKSTDSGATWKKIAGSGFPESGVSRIGIAVAPSNSQRIYAIVDMQKPGSAGEVDKKRGGLYRSDDAGATWKLVDNERRIWGRGWYFCEVAVDPKKPDTVYVSNTSVYRSTDGGMTTTAIKGAPGGDDYHQLWIDPANGDRMILGSDQGTVVTVDRAQTWSSWYNQSTAQMYHVIADNAFPFRLFGAQQDSGAAMVPSQSMHRAISARDWEPINVGGESDMIAPDPLDPDTVYGGRVGVENLRTHAYRSIPPDLAQHGDYRGEWTLPLVFSQADPHALYFGFNQLFRTTNGGSSWSLVSPDLTRPNPGTPPNLDPSTATDAPVQKRGVIYTIAPSPLDAKTIWAGTDDGNIQLTRDGGATWQNVTPANLPAWSKVGIIDASHFGLGTAYAAVERHRVDDRHPYIFRTRDFGRSWQLVVSGLPTDTFVNAIREDPARAGLLYAGTESSVAVSYDGGERWHSLKLDLPDVSVRDLVVHGNALAIATHGRGFYIIDDLTPVREWNAAVGSESEHLFAPPRAYRMIARDEEGTPLPLDEPQLENPAAGATIAYRLAGDAKTVDLDVFDARGILVRHWSSSDPVTPVDPANLDIPAFWVTPPARLGTTAGMHRWTWDLRAASKLPPVLDDDGDPIGGPWVVPGTYRVRLTVDGRVKARPLTVALDPRIHVGHAALAQQYAFTRQIERLRAAVLARGKAGAALERRLQRLTAAVQSAPAAPSTDARLEYAALKAAATKR